eukprot:m.217621 g.217621  ORF g.217621 m.217621 type:complete len:278 (+) comp15889_c0_seq1:219-1052(+)
MPASNQLTKSNMNSEYQECEQNYDSYDSSCEDMESQDGARSCHSDCLHCNPSTTILDASEDECREGEEADDSDDCCGSCEICLRRKKAAHCADLIRERLRQKLLAKDAKSSKKKRSNPPSDSQSKEELSLEEILSFIEGSSKDNHSSSHMLGKAQSKTEKREKRRRKRQQEQLRKREEINHRKIIQDNTSNSTEQEKLQHRQNPCTTCSESKSTEPDTFLGENDFTDDEFSKELEKFKCFCDAPRPTVRRKVDINMGTLKNLVTLHKRLPSEISAKV